MAKRLAEPELAAERHRGSRSAHGSRMGQEQRYAPRGGLRAIAVTDGQLRVAIVAEHASARFGGEAILPLQYFSQLRQRGIEAWLVVHARTQQELSSLMPGETSRIIYVPDTWLHRALSRASTLLPDRIATFSTGWISHLYTQLRQRSLVKRLVRREGINVVHEPIPVSPAMPSMTVGVGAPVVIGPLNGGMSYPSGFLHLESRLERMSINLGRALTNLFNHLIPGKKRAAMVLVANERTRKALPRCARGKIVELVENGVDFRKWRFVDRAGRVGPLAFVFVGRLIRLKAVDLLVEAFRSVREERDCRLWIVGDGPQRRSLQEKADSLPIRDDIVFHGFVDQDRCSEILGEADIMVMPSLHECGGAVVLEAMATGMPVIAANWGGPSDYLDEDTGVLVEPMDQGRFVRALAQAMSDLCEQRDHALTMGRRARRRAAERFDWQRKIDRILDLYREVSSSHQS